MTIRIKEPCKLLNSIAIALVMSAQYLSYIANLYLGIRGGTVTLMVLIGLALEFGCVLLKKGLPTFRKNNLLLFGYILGYFALSFLISRGPSTQEYLIEFLSYGTFALLATARERDDELILTLLMSLTFFFWISPGRFVSSSIMKQLNYSRMDMFFSYIMILSLLAAAFHFCFYRRRTPFAWLLYGLNLGECVIGFSVLGRGPILVLFVACVFIWNRKTLDAGKFWSAKRAAILIPAFIAAVVLILNFNAIVIGIDNFLQSRGITVALFHKMALLVSKTGSVLNNREEVWGNAFEMILKSPLVGNGIASYANRYDTWPHNLFLQILVEMGIVGGLPLLARIIGKLKRVLIRHELRLDDSVFFYLVLCYSVVRLMFSSHLWHLPEFWLFFFNVPVLVGTAGKEEGMKTL